MLRRVAVCLLVGLSAAQAVARDAGAAPRAPKGAALDPSMVAGEVKGHLGQIKACYERALHDTPSLRGRVDLHWTITMTGAVAGVGVDLDSVGDGRVAECIVAQVARWKFPAPSGGAVDVSFPFVFESETPIEEASLGDGLPSPDRERKPWRSVHVVYETSRAAPKRGVVVTLVSAEPSLPTLVARVENAVRDEHDDATVVHVEPTDDVAWTGWAPPSMDHAWRYPRVAVLAGEHRTARLLATKTLAAKELPKGTRAEDVLLAIDADGDGRPDVVARTTCPKGESVCELACEEVWVRGKAWRRSDRVCSD
jgi:hypothetical protein